MFKEQFKPAILVFLILTILTGILYPLAVTGIAQLCFHKKANGSLIYCENKAIGSTLIGQQFDDPRYFWGRASATRPAAFNASSSSGSNLGPMNPALSKSVKDRIKALKVADPNNTSPVPIDLVTSSASGLDPHISLAGAYYQVSRISRVRNLSEDTVREIILKHGENRFLGVISEPVVNVLELNIALDEYKK